MDISIILTTLFIYFVFIFGISYITSLRATSSSYFSGDKESPWYIVALGMLSDSLSGVTFISVPGTIIAAKFGYLQIVYGYFFGYLVIIFVLLPLYYRLNLVSIYSYLNTRYGKFSQYIGSFYFLISRILGSAARLFLAISVFQLFIFNQLNIPFWLAVFIVIFIIWIYTVKGGIKTLVYTDAFQSILLIFGVLFSIYYIATTYNFGIVDLSKMVYNNPLSDTFEWDIMSKNNFFKQFLGGIFIAICMTGLDQNMMQKNLSCKSLSESQKNMFWFSVTLVITNICFMSLGVLLYQYATDNAIVLPMDEMGNIITDKVFPYLALNKLGTLAGLAFITGLIAATFSSVDSVLTTLTTSFYIDFLGKDPDKSSAAERSKIHFIFAIIILIVILIINSFGTLTVIDIVLLIANYTYGPLLGLFAFGLFTKSKPIDKLVPVVCIISPFISYGIDIFFDNFKLGNTVLIINGIITFVFLLLLSYFNSINSK